MRAEALKLGLHDVRHRHAGLPAETRRDVVVRFFREADPSWRCGRKPSSLFYHEHPNSSLLSMAKAVVHEREFPSHVRHELEDHSAASRDVERLYAVNRVARRCADVHRVELLADDVERAWDRWTCGDDIKSYPITAFHAERLRLILPGAAI